MRVYKSLKKFFDLSLIAAFLVAGIIVTHPVSAGTITVINAFDSGNGSLRQAIMDAHPGDTIGFNVSLSGATITLESQLVIDKNLIIDGASLFSPITISGDNLNRVFLIHINVTVTLSSLVISEGYASEGAGIYNVGALTLRGSTISNNHATSDGGGIYNELIGDSDIPHPTLTVINSTFLGNSADTGGGIMAFDQVAVTGSTIIGNAAQRGGGIACYGDLMVSNSSFTENKADIYGGGIAESGVSTTLINNIFAGNTAGDKGGAIYDYSDNLVIRDSFFRKNDAKDGGGVYHNNGSFILTKSTFAENLAIEHGGGIVNVSTLEVSNSTFARNVAYSGGGIWNEGNSTIGNSTLSRNSTEYRGGGIENYSGDLTVINCTLSGNTSALGGGIDNNTGSLYFVNTIVANSTSGGDCINDGGMINTNKNNFVEDGNCNNNAINMITGDPMLDDLGDYGGATETHALLSTSAAIDAGDIATCIGALIAGKDQRGMTRPQGAGCDIGSYELRENHPPAFSSLPVTSAMIGETYVYDILTTDPDLEYGDWLSIDFANTLPGWLILTDNEDGTARLAGKPGINDEGSHEVKLIVTDSFGASASQTFTITVFRPGNKVIVLFLPMVVKE